MIDYECCEDVRFELHQLYIEHQIVVLSLDWNVDTVLTRDLVCGNTSSWSGERIDLKAICVYTSNIVN